MSLLAGSLRRGTRDANSPRNPRSLLLAAVELRTIVVLEGDQTGQELLEEALRVLSPDVTGLEIDLPRFDLSLERRRATGRRLRTLQAARRRRSTPTR